MTLRNALEWTGDAIGCACLFSAGYIGFVAVGVL
jgi:hypothetical protein